MKQAMKRFGAMLLTMAMLLSLAVTGVSAEGAGSTTTPTVKIQFNGLGNEAGEAGNDTLKAYRVIKYTNDSCNAFEGDDGIVNGETTFWEYLQRKSSGKDPAEYLENDVKDATALRNLLNGFMTVSDGTSLNTKVAFTATNGETKQVETGYYILQVASNSKIYNTMLLFVGYENGQLVAKMNGDNYMTGDAAQGYTATMKSEDGPTVKKFVFDDRGVTADGRAEALKDQNKWRSAAASEVGKVVDFAIKVELPTYHNDAAVELTLNDTLTNLEYKGGNFTGDALSFEGVKVYCKDSTDNYKLVINGIKSVTAYDYANGTQKLTIGLDYANLKQTNATEFYVYYQATLRENAVANNEHKGTNEVVLNYNVKTSAGTYNGAPSDKVDVYTYNFDLKKYYNGSADGRHETSAEFSVFTAVSGNDVDNSSVMKFKKVTDADGKKEYYYPVAATENGDGIFTEIPADFEIRGLDVSTPYYVKEVETPAGYYAPSSYFTLQLSGDEKAATTVLNGELKYDNPNDYSAPSSFVANDKVKDQALVKNGKTTAGDANRYGAINDPNKYQYDVTLNNSSTPVLPSTGGMGTTLFTVGGVALLALAAAMLILRRRKN